MIVCEHGRKAGELCPLCHGYVEIEQDEPEPEEPKPDDDESDSN